MGKPTFSIIIPALNEEKFLPNLLTSLAAQTNSDFEVIVVDGSSKDRTVQLAKAFVKRVPNLRIIVSKVASLPLQRNLGAHTARGDWFVFIDADSVLMPYFIDRIAVYIAAKKPEMFTTWAQPDTDVNNDAILTLFANLFWESMVVWKRPAAPGPLTIIQRDIFMQVGGYDESHAFNEDVDLGLRLARHGIILQVLRESLYVWSLRRFRHEGKLKLAQQLVISSLPVLFLRRAMKRMPGYIMGGQIYQKKKPIKQTALKQYERKLKLLMKEFFA